MTVTNVERDLDRLNLTIHTEFAAGPDRIWQLWQDPRLLEQWWGPPSHPATVEQHELTPGGTVKYFMSGPDGEKYPGQWRVVSVEPPAGLEVEDVFADENGNPDPSMPTSTMRVTIVQSDDDPEITRMTLRTSFQSREAMEQVLEMGAAEGMSLALGQIDEMLATDLA